MLTKLTKRHPQELSLDGRFLFHLCNELPECFQKDPLLNSSRISHYHLALKCILMAPNETINKYIAFTQQRKKKQGPSKIEPRNIN